MNCRTCEQEIIPTAKRWVCRCCGNSFHCSCVTEQEKDNHICMQCDKYEDSTRAEYEEALFRMQLESEEEE